MNPLLNGVDFFVPTLLCTISVIKIGVIILRGSFYYWIPVMQLDELQTFLAAHDITFHIGFGNCTYILKNHVAIIFPDLPVRKYAKVHECFGRVGHPFFDGND